jgi:hypothetical protein
MPPTSFPSSADAYPDPAGGATQGSTTPTHSGHHQNHNDAIEAIEAKVGTGASTPAANTVLRGTGAGTTAYGQVVTGDLAASAVTQSGVKTASATVSTSSAVPSVIPDDGAGEMAVTLTTTGGPLLAGFAGTISNGLATGQNVLGFSLDGAGLGDAMAYSAPAANAFGAHSFTLLMTGLAAGSHTVRVLWRANSGTATAFGRSLWVVELKR